jgi:hypothetical protein
MLMRAQFRRHAAITHAMPPTGYPSLTSLSSYHTHHNLKNLPNAQIPGAMNQVNASNVEND